MHHQGNYRDQEQQVDQTSRHVKSQKAKEPQNQQNKKLD
jgi:hypothetical protein